MNNNARTTQAVGTGAPVESGIPDVKAAVKAQQPPRPPVDDNDNKHDGTNTTSNNNTNTIQDNTMQEKNNTKRSHPPSSPSLPNREKKRSTTTNKNNTIRRNKWELTPISILLRTMGYMDNDTLMIMCLVCQQIKELIWSGQGMETKLIRIFELRPSEDKKYNTGWSQNYDNGWGRKRIELFLYSMNRYCRDGTKQRMLLQGYQHWKIYHPQQMLFFGTNAEELEGIVPSHLRMMGIVDFDMSSPVPIHSHSQSFELVKILTLLVPNLRRLNISNIDVNPDYLIPLLSQRCPHLEVIKWNNNEALFFFADGRHFKCIKNLKELHLDRAEFFFTAKINEDNADVDTDDDAANDTGYDDDDADDVVREDRAMVDMKNYPNIFLFYKLFKNNPLERVSIRHARWEKAHPNMLDPEFTTQKVLMKFVRKAPPSLVWFRSDLSSENIRILQSERPGIQLLN